MTKKLVVGVLLLGLIGLLVIGAAFRTADRTGLVAQAAGLEGRGYGAGQGELSEAAAAGQGGGRGNGGGQGRLSESAAPGLGQAAGVAPDSSALPAEAWQTLSGTVTAMDADALQVATAGGEIVVEGRAWSFAQEQGLLVGPGDAVSLTGFYEGDAFEVAAIDNLTAGQSIALRDETGRPLWAGRGRRSG